jgi:uncharacterized damage-inducible protein DinB
MKQHFAMMAAYNRWANGRVYEAAADLGEYELNRKTGAFFPTLLRTLNHILVADRIWMKRFTGSGEAPAALDTVLFSALPALRIARETEDRRIEGWIEGLSEADLAGRFAYTTVTDMRTVSQRLAPALAHFFNHQTHHRGQAHTILTTLGQPSVQLDLIYFQRTPDGREFA